MPSKMRVTEYRETDDVFYEARVVAFFDILGWRKTVEESTTSLELRRKLLNAVWALGELSKKDVEDDTPDYPSFDRVSQFSDSVVVSLPYSGYLDLQRLIQQVTTYQHTMILSGLPLRGGITVGSLYHQGSLVFGPALNEAYTLESQKAIHPRVIIAKSLNKQVEKAAQSLPRHWPFVVMDADGFYCTDYLLLLATSKSATGQLDHKIDHWLSVHQGDERIYAKYRWLKDRWDAAKRDSGWRVEVSRRLR